MSERYHLRSVPEAERVIIGALLLSSMNGDAKCRTTAFGRLSARDFADASLQALFSAAKRLDDRGDLLEPTLWLSEVEGKLPRDEAATQLRECGECVVTTATVASYVRIVAEASCQRRLVCAANDALNARSTDQISDAIASLQAALSDINRACTHGVELIRATDVQPEPVDWLWPGRIAIGKVTLLAGDPGLGKSLMTLDIAARVTRGAPWPDAPLDPHSAGDVVLLSAEDDLADTIRPRLDAHEAACERVFALTSLGDLSHDISQLRTAIEHAGNCRLVVVDPVSAFMGRAHSHINSEVRAVLAPLAALAAEMRVAILAVTHLRKGEGAAIYRAMGSLGFVAAARAAWAVVRDKKNPKRRLLLSVKNNLAADTANGLAFEIEGHGADNSPVVYWESAPLSITADEALAPAPKKRGRPANDRQAAEQWLLQSLGDGPRAAKDVIREAVEDRCISKRTLERAQQEIGVVAFRPTNPGPWWWRLSDGSDRPNDHATTSVHEFWLSGDVPENTEDSGTNRGQYATTPKNFCHEV